MIFMQWFGDNNITEQSASQYLSLYLSDSLKFLGVSSKLQLMPTGHYYSYQK